jgi:hypothetical protein
LLLESEAGKEFDDYNTLFVGVGKISASYHLTKAILAHKPDLIINLGTAGVPNLTGEVWLTATVLSKEIWMFGLWVFRSLKRLFPMILWYWIMVYQ